VYNGGDNKDFNLHLMVMNKQDLAVSQNSKADHMQLENVAVTDNNGTDYQCEVSDTSNQNLQPNQAASLARLSCQPILSPDVKFLQVKTQLTNWGAREFQIPITLDMDKLDVRYQVDRRADSAVLDISFYAKEPQNVELYYADISLLDGKGSRISMEPCRPGGAWFGETGPNYSTLAQSYQHGKDLTCEIPQAIGEDVNAITLVMTIRGKTVSLTTPVDTLSGTIKYGPED
jgi:hypothetical protein